MDEKMQVKQTQWGAAWGAAVGLTVQAAADYERAMIQVQNACAVTTTSLEGLTHVLKDMAAEAAWRRRPWLIRLGHKLCGFDQ